MSVINPQKELFKGVGVMRDILPFARVFYDIVTYEDGFAGFAVWQRNTYRIPFISHLRDYLKRRKRTNVSRETVIQEDERNFFIAYDDIQGIVSYDDHKELQILSSLEQLTILYRSVADYDSFINELKTKIEDKIFNRDAIKIINSVYL